ncbi:MAG: molybdenum cofactor guanylyltransferase MobA [Helicobacteraceae bacterium]|nr:molybdenum cofactor guanylyltransferase MobA [Helicobacteraceae bacterium]
MFQMPCVIFAGGRSSRMGEDKSLLPFANFETLSEFQYTRLQKIFKNVYISTKSRDKFNFEANFIEDPKECETFAPTAGFVSIFEKLKSNQIFVLSVDTPFVGSEEIAKLLNEENFDAVIAKSGSGTHPMCGVYSRSLEFEFKKMLKEGNHKLGMLLKNSNTKFVEFKDEEPFLNLNHKHEYEEALRRVK